MALRTLVTSIFHTLKLGRGVVFQFMSLGFKVWTPNLGACPLVLLLVGF